MVHTDIHMCVYVGTTFLYGFFFKDQGRSRKHAFLSMMGVFCCWPWGWPTTAWHNEKPWKNPPMAGHTLPETIIDTKNDGFEKMYLLSNMAILSIYVRFQGGNSKPCPTIKRPGLNKSWLFYKSNMDRKEPHSRWTRHFVVATIQGSSPVIPNCR